MVIFYGTNTFGPVDEIDNVGRVETRFFHVWFLPLIPLGSLFVVDGDDERAVRVPFSFKSLMTAWLRAAFGWSGFALLAFAAYHAIETGKAVPIVASAVAAIGSLVVFWLIGRLMARCSPARRTELLAHMGIAAPPAPPARISQPPLPVASVAPPAARLPAPTPRPVQETTQLWDMATPLPEAPASVHGSSYPPPVPTTPDYSQGEDRTMFLQPAFAQAGHQGGLPGGGWS
jgi:hypothetical protein